MLDFTDETPTITEAYESLSETARKWQEELQRGKLRAYENQGPQKVYEAR